MAISGLESEGGQPMNLVPGPPSEEAGRRLAIIVLFVITGLALWGCYLSWRQASRSPASSRRRNRTHCPDSPRSAGSP